MKSLLISLCLFTALCANASPTYPVFKADSPVPAELQQRILSAVTAQCGTLYTYYRFYEEETLVRLDRVDQGVTDKYFTTTLINGELRGHPELTIRITVESAEYAFNNGDNLDVISVTSPDGCK